MVLSPRESDYLERQLEYSFLYNSDPNAIHVLLSILDHQSNISALMPKYQCTRNIGSALKRTLKHRKDKDGIIHTLKRLINDDTNRFELAMYLHGYRHALRDKSKVDQLEYAGLEIFGAEYLYNATTLFHQTNERRVLKMQVSYCNEIQRKDALKRSIKKLANYYCDKVIRHKIYNLNRYLDKQLIIDYEDASNIVFDEDYLTIAELSMVYRKFVLYLVRNICRVYLDAYWTGLNDAVLKRYL